MSPPITSSSLVESYQQVMREAFEIVCPKENWKDAIDTRVTLTTEAEMTIIREAVIFFTGSVPEFSRIGNTRIYRVRAAGYYATIGA